MLQLIYGIWFLLTQDKLNFYLHNNGILFQLRIVNIKADLSKEMKLGKDYINYS